MGATSFVHRSMLKGCSGSLNFTVFKLHLDEACIVAIAAHQQIMGALLHDLSLVNHQNGIGITNSA